LVVSPSKDTDPAAKARRARNIALGLGLAALVILIFVVTLVRLGGNVALRPI
jgi:hypothetical protein